MTLCWIAYSNSISLAVGVISASYFKYDKHCIFWKHQAGHCTVDSHGPTDPHLRHPHPSAPHTQRSQIRAGCSTASHPFTAWLNQTQLTSASPTTQTVTKKDFCKRFPTPPDAIFYRDSQQSTVTLLRTDPTVQHRLQAPRDTHTIKTPFTEAYNGPQLPLCGQCVVFTMCYSFL